MRERSGVVLTDEKVLGGISCLYNSAHGITGKIDELSLTATANNYDIVKYL